MKLLALGIVGSALAWALYPHDFKVEAGKTYRWKARAVPPLTDEERLTLGVLMQGASIPYAFGKTDAESTRLEFTLQSPETTVYSPGKQQFEVLGKKLIIDGAKEV